MLDTILGRMTTPVWVFDIDRSRMLWANAAGCLLWRTDTLDELCARDFASGMSVTVATRLRQYQQEFERSDAAFSDVWTHYPKDLPSTILVTYSGIKLTDGRIAMLCEGGKELNETPEKLWSAEALMHTSVMIMLHDEDGRVLYRNPAASAMTPTDADTMDARFIDAAVFQQLRSKLVEYGEVQIVAEVRTAFGTRWHEITAQRCMDPVTGRPALLSSEVDISEIKRAEAQARHDACHDQLTDLPNRAFVKTVFEQRLARLLEEGRQSALLFVDLDRFKTINDSLGHTRGDQVLVEVANRLRWTIGLRGDVARLGGDEFLVLLESVPDPKELDEIVGDLREAVHSPILLGENSLRVTCSIGVSTAPADGRALATLMKNADSAMYGAKKAGGNRRVHFTAAMDIEAGTRMQMEIDLRRDFEAGLLQLHYQPRVSIRTGRIVSAEALLRWPRASGHVPPDVFIPLAEESGLIVPLGAWVLHEAACQQLAWKRAGCSVKLSVNVSPRQLEEGNFLQVARKVLLQTGCSSTELELEITEQLLLGEQPYIAQTLKDLRGMGFRISIDDFGVGYSNLAELHKHPIDCLKIDRSFISNLDEQGPIMDLIINMGRLLKLCVVAEGVETDEQLAWLSTRECDEYQGYHYSRPVPAEALQTMLLADAAAFPARYDRRL